MKRILRFFRSMTFGMIILGLIVLVSVAGSLIQQNQEPMYYVRTYPQWYGILLQLRLNDVFNSWYFNLLIIFLLLNLSFCSILRFHTVTRDQERKTASLAVSDVKLNVEEIQKVRAALEKKHCKKEETGERTIYYKYRFGRYGTFITHLGILLAVIFFALALHTPVVTDESCYPGHEITMDDGTVIHVDSFQIEDPNGKLDYKSTLEITLPNGKSSGEKKSSVNHPVSFGNYKVYQQTYGTVGLIKVKDEDGHEDEFIMDKKMFLTKDQKTGILFNALYPDLVTGEDGSYSLVTNVTGEYPNPVYTFNLVENGDTDQEKKMTPMLAFPGDEVEVGVLKFIFEDPMEYPGLRIKKSPVWVNFLLLFGFAVLTAGLAVTFLMEPVLVVVDKEGCRIMGKKKEGIRLYLEMETGRSFAPVLSSEKEVHSQLTEKREMQETAEKKEGEKDA